MSDGPTVAGGRLRERGDPAPWFRGAALGGNRDYCFDTVAGRHILLLFFDSARGADVASALGEVRRNRALFDDKRACFFGISCDPSDAAAGRIAQHLPGIRYFLDYDRSISTLYGAQAPGGHRPHWLVLDPALRVVDVFALERGDEAIALVRRESEASRDSGFAPVLVVPNVLTADLTSELIDLYERHGGEESGFMREVEGKTVRLLDPAHKQRRDYVIEDEEVRKRVLGQIGSHLTVPIVRAFQFQPTRIERYLVACYEAGAGHFRPHRDNTTSGTAHRKFAVTINLNSEDYDGGDLRFPEYGARTYRAPTGGAIVFSCSLLHEATPVTRGRRYAFLPFLYDEEGAAIRESNNPRLGEGVGAYTRS